ncbi:hypothetical protein NUU61_002054 [Penicillium alfredii]|uniref:Spindle pole body associated protein SnaD n=1 Tax=Penicillium alfredii TaxID=1506179 RepID=A0A9W9FRG8_9EURO|nr:uncharacterized protein NUU61_002054 [Penicillium alfredii]KAJ5104707.1 hypothetical protein NUU61_002054 [Penicillium alfredii]
MANTGYTSPFPTSHDTIGQSTLVTPLFMPSSPPQHSPSLPAESPRSAGSPVRERTTTNTATNDDDHEHNHQDHRDNEVQNLSPPLSPVSPSGSDLDARLADYTLDFSQFPSGQFAIDGDDAELLPDLKNDAQDELSDVGGPHDFTANMEKYLMGGDEDIANDLSEDEAEMQPALASEHNPVGSRQPAVEEEADSGEYSECGPPVDMSTPSHMLHRASALAKQSTHLEDIEEYPEDVSQDQLSPSARKQSMTSGSDAGSEERNEGLSHRITQLKNATRNRDEQWQHDHERELEADPTEEQIRELQEELQRKNERMQELLAASKGGSQDPSLESLKNGDIAVFFDRLRMHEASGFMPRIRELENKIQELVSQSSLEAERVETIAHLRQQIDHHQEQLKKRDATLDETTAKLRETTQANEGELQEKDAEIERLNRELGRLNDDHHSLEERFTKLETRNRPLEEKNQTLEVDLTRVQSQVEAQENALKAVAADFPAPSHSTFSEILDLIKEINGPDPSFPVKDKRAEEGDAKLLGQQVLKLQDAMHEAQAAQKAANAESSQLREQLSESQALVEAIETENARLTTRVDELTTTMNKSQHELTRAREEHARSLETIARLQEDKITEPPSPPLSPSIAQGTVHSESSGPAPNTAALEASHQAQLRSLQTAHATAVSTLRASHSESMRKVCNSLTQSKQREADLRAEFETTRDTANKQISQLRQSHKSKIKHLEAALAARDEANAEVDQRIAASVRKIELKWERRLNLVLNDRDRLAKVLMTLWGAQDEKNSDNSNNKNKKENHRHDGDRAHAKDGQAYRYKYANKNKARGREKGSLGG